jgi:hypothetical protein
MSTASLPCDSWHGALRLAKGHRAAGRLRDALSCSDRAVSAVDALLGASPLSAPLLMAKTVSHLHRAAVLDRLERTRAADREYRSAWAFARAVADDALQPAGLRRAACRHARLAVAEWQGARGPERRCLAADVAAPDAAEAGLVLH